MHAIYTIQFSRQKDVGAQNLYRRRLMTLDLLGIVLPERIYERGAVNLW